MTSVDIPLYSESHYEELTQTLDPISTFGGFSVKRGDAFELGPVCGSKVRQCLHVVKCLRGEHEGLITGAGLPTCGLMEEWISQKWN